MSERLSLEAFQAELNQPFEIALDGQAGRLALELIAVRDLGARRLPSGEMLPNYSLLFCSRGEQRAFPQAIYRLENARLGALEIFLVPTGPDASGMCYEAIFN